MKICPRCGRKFDRLLALSRVDNKTMICDGCGMEEAFLDFFGHIVKKPVDTNVEEKLENESTNLRFNPAEAVAVTHSFSNIL